MEGCLLNPPSRNFGNLQPHYPLIMVLIQLPSALIQETEFNFAPFIHLPVLGVETSHPIPRKLTANSKRTIAVNDGVLNKIN